jgi:NAD-dependent DNA ligase
MSSKIQFDPVDLLVDDLSSGKSATTLVARIKLLSREKFQTLLDALSEAYHHSEPIVSDADYDLIEGIFKAKFGKNVKVGAPPPSEAEEDGCPSCPSCSMKGDVVFKYCAKCRTKKSPPGKVKAPKKPPKGLGKDEVKGSADGLVIRPSGARPEEAKLPVPLFGLDKLTDDHGLGLYLKRYKDCDRFVVTDKLDGNSAYLEYTHAGEGKDQILHMYKRGDEKIGTNISYLIPYFDVPKRVPLSAPGETFAVRMELVMPLKVFAEKYAEDMANTRNMVSGLTNSKTADASKVRDIHAVAYHIYSGTPLPQSEQLTRLASLGFKVPSSVILSRADLTTEGLTAEVKLRKRRCPYDMDGIVIAADLPLPLPTTKDPEHVVAFKILGETAVTTVRSVTWEVGKIGYYKPTVSFDPVNLDGANISSATGNNGRFVQAYGLGPGAKIVITRSGGVIPKILETISPVDPEFPPEGEYRWVENDKGEKVEIAPPEGEEMGDEQRIKRLTAFFKELGAEYLAETTIAKLYHGGLDSLEALFEADEEDITSIPGFQERSAERILENIHGCIKDVPLAHVMAASSLFPKLGKKVLTLITAEIPGLDKVDDEDQLDDIREQVVGIKSIGAKRADVFVENLIEFNEFLASHRKHITIAAEGADNDKAKNDDTDSDDDDPKIAPEESKTVSLKGETLVFTGCRAKGELQRAIERKGGRITSAVSGQTTTVIVKSLSGKLSGKVKEAQDRGVRIMELKDFLDVYGLQEDA